MKKNYFLIFSFLFFLISVSTLFADSNFVIRFDNPDTQVVNKFSADRYDIAAYKPGEFLDLVVAESQYQEILAQGFEVEITQTEEQLINNLNDHTDLDGYRDYEQLLTELQLIENSNPDICKLYDIGDSWGKIYAANGFSNYDEYDHEIWALKLSDNVEVEEDEPSIYYLAEHHAREPISLEVVTIQDGEMNLYGTYGDNSVWGFSQDASLNMSGGLLDIKELGIWISDSYNFVETITGGTIRTVGQFGGVRPDFNPIGGTIELYGTTDANISHASGSNFYDVLINKAATDEITRGSKDDKGISYNRDGSIIEYTRSNTANAASDLDINGNLQIDSGKFNLNGNTVNVANDVAVNSGGILNINQDAVLNMADNKWLNVNNGGTIELIGLAGNEATISHTSGHYYFWVESGGTISAENAIFEYMRTDGIYIRPGSLVDPAHSFNNCIFQNGISSGRLLTVYNTQDFIVNNAVFPSNTWGGAYNVFKNSTLGNVTFINATGGFSGAAYENDPYNLVHWSTGVLPVIDDLAIKYNSGTDEIELTWTYSESFDHFNIYRSIDPYDFSSAVVFTTTTVGYSEPASGTKYFYFVTAVNGSDNVGSMGKSSPSETAPWSK